MPKGILQPWELIVTERLVLRKIAPADASDLALIRSNAEVNRYLDRTAQLTVAGAEKYIEKIKKGVKARKWYYWAITTKGEDKLIGTVCLWNIDKKCNRIELGYELEPARQGKGLMFEAAQAVINFGFRMLCFGTVMAITHRQNQRSVILLEKLGFKNGEYGQGINDDDIYLYLNRDAKKNSPDV